MAQDKPPSVSSAKGNIDPVPAPTATELGEFKDKKDISHVERVLSPSDNPKNDDMDFSRVDREVQEYATRGQVEVDDATSRRLRRMIDRRVLVIMILTYFLQALDKGTMSFASIMGIREQLNLHGQQVCRSFALKPKTNEC